MIQAINCSNCKRLVCLKDSQKVILNNKKARLCQECFDEIKGSMSHNKLIEGLNNGEIRVR